MVAKCKIKYSIFRFNS